MKATKQLDPPTFLKFYPNEQACLDDIFDRVYGDLKFCPSCEVETKWHHLKGRKCYSCQWCGHLLSPLSKTPLANTKISIHLWFFAILLFGNSKNGVSAKELQRQLGVSYPTAFRIGHTIREMLNEEGEITLGGRVEMDETLVGGRQRGGKRGWGSNTACIFGMVERGGDIITRVVPDRKAETLMLIIVDNTTEDFVADTDEFSGYNKLKREVKEHHTIRHKDREHVAGKDGEIHTQTIDGHWSIIKRSIRGTQTAVSKHKLQAYLNEFAFRRNHRTERLFDSILKRVVQERFEPSPFLEPNILSRFLRNCTTCFAPSCFGAGLIPFVGSFFLPFSIVQ